MLKFDFIIPICNMNNDGFEERFRNLMVITNNLPKNNSVHLILIEQIINKENPKFLDHLNIPEKLDHTKVFVEFPVFNKPWLFNLGVKESKYQNLLLSEMDVNINPGYIEKIEEYLLDINKPGKKWFFAWNKILYWNKELNKVEQEHTCSKGMREGGLIFIKKDYYWEIGGGNEFIQELGGPDNEFIRRAEHLTNNYPKMKGTIHHLWHPIHNLKTNDWKNSTRRDRNRQIYGIVKSRPNLMMSILKEHIKYLGNKNCPLCNKLSDKIIFERRKLIR